MDALFHEVRGICVDKIGNVLIVDSKNHCIRQLSLPFDEVTYYDYEASKCVGSGGDKGYRDGEDALFNSPSGICIEDSPGDFIVADTYNHCIRRIGLYGPVTTIAGKAGKAGHRDGKDALFNYPHGVCMDSFGNVIVTDSYNHCIRRITRDGIVTTIAGTIEKHGHCDGNPNEAMFCFPAGICLARNGNLIVADTENHCIRSISMEGAVSTIAGTAGKHGYCDGKGINALFYLPRFPKPTTPRVIKTNGSAL
jgi:sugar lactone lactonase YvrE